MKICAACDGATAGPICETCKGEGLVQDSGAVLTRSQRAAVRTPKVEREHGPLYSTWFGRGVWPTCTCGFDPKDNAALTRHWAEHGFRVVDVRGTLTKFPLTWAVIGCDQLGVTVECRGDDPTELVDRVAPWAQQEEDRWPQEGLLYMLVEPTDAHLIPEDA